MTLDDLAKSREAERAWAHANGFNNGDPATNGEYACVDRLLAHADLFVDVGANEGLFVERATAVKTIAFEPNPATPTPCAPSSLQPVVWKASRSPMRPALRPCTSTRPTTPPPASANARA
jgi:hypothetical protein